MEDKDTMSPNDQESEPLDPSEIEYDPDKNIKNIEKHGVALSEALFFCFQYALTVIDDRKDYGEERYNAYGLDMQYRLMVITYTLRNGKRRIISYRRGNKRERILFFAYYDKLYS